MTDKVTDAVCFEMVLKQRDEARCRIEKLERTLIDIKAITMEYPPGREVCILIREFANAALGGGR